MMAGFSWQKKVTQCKNKTLRCHINIRILRQKQPNNEGLSLLTFLDSFYHGEGVSTGA